MTEDVPRARETGIQEEETAVWTQEARDALTHEIRGRIIRETETAAQMEEVRVIREAVTVVHREIEIQEVRAIREIVMAVLTQEARATRETGMAVWMEEVRIIREIETAAHRETETDKEVSLRVPVPASGTI